jgi:hypothetical protein
MAKATIRTVSESPSDQLTPAGDDIRRVTDKLGRKIGIRQLTVLQEMRLLKILGEFNSSYFNLCAQLARVAEINGEVVHVPNSEREIEVIGQRLGREGLAALMESVAQPVEDDGDEERSKEQLKK